VFFHALPGSFYDEVLSTIPLAGVLDLCPGDGALALSSYKKGICYTGLCFSDSHNKFLSKHLERNVWRAMSDDADLLYEPRLVVSLVDDGGAARSRREDQFRKGKATAQSKGETCQQAAPLTGL